MMGLHHAREWPSGEHAMEFAVDLVKNYTSGNARITGLLKQTRVLIVPVINPDGSSSRASGDLVVIREIEDGGQVTILGNPGNAYKRKNCRIAVGADTTPAGACAVTSPGGFGLGVDLNRKYGGSGAGPARQGLRRSGLSGRGPVLGARDAGSARADAGSICRTASRSSSAEPEETRFTIRVSPTRRGRGRSSSERC
jgi:hypothetical protein